jgi:hypothetical protein
MEIRAGGKTILEPNATVRMSDGDHLSIAYTDVHGDTRLVNISARAIALVIKEQRTGDEMFVQHPKYGNVFMEGQPCFSNLS